MKTAKRAINFVLLGLAIKFGDDFTEEVSFNPDSKDEVGFFQRDKLEW